MKKLSVLSLALTLALAVACGWTAEQKEVKEAYISLIDAFDAGDYGKAFDLMSANTQQFLDDLALGLEAWGYPMGSSGRELLKEMFTGEDMTGLTRTISTITIEGERATLVAEAEEGPDVLEYVREDGEWRIDLETMIRDGFSEGLEGSGFTIEDILEAPYVDYDFTFETGDGICPVDIINSLGDYDIWYIYVDPSDAPWSDDRLGSEILYPGEMFTVWVDPGMYDIMVEDEDGDTYTLWGVEVDEAGVYWEVTLADMD